MEKILNLIQELVNFYKEEKNLITDPIRGGERIEIPVGFAMVILKYNLEEYRDFAKNLLDLILEKQDPVGFWLEYSYKEKTAMHGFAGTISTCFAIFALVEGYKKFKNEKYLESIRRASQWLYQNEKDGYFLKASLNKSDVINTNLMAGLALLKVAEILPPNDQSISFYQFAVSRALRRSISSQFYSGAYPYISFGLTTPFLYHAMSLALIGLYNQYFQKEIICFSFKKGLKYLNKIIDKQGNFLWQKANNKDKQGAIWAYAWAIVCMVLVDDQKKTVILINHLEKLKGREFLKNGDFDEREDLFFTAWSMLVLSLIDNQKIDFSKIGISSKIKFYFLILSIIPCRIKYIFKIISRRFFHFSIDKGPVEDY